VTELLRLGALPTLVERVLSPSTPTPARNWLVSRLEAVPDAVPLDWEAVYTTQLDDASCTVRRKAIESLRRLGRLATAGVLLREVHRNDGCTRAAARRAVSELVESASSRPPAVHAPSSPMASQ